MAMTFWDRYAAFGYDALRVILPYEELQCAVRATAAFGPDERLLVAGCGTGNLEWMATQQEPTLEVDAVDLSTSMLARAQAKCAGNPRVRHHLANLCKSLPFPDAQFDVAVMTNVLYALPDQRRALREIYRLLKPGGRFVLCDRHPWSTVPPVTRAHFAGLRALPTGQRIKRWMHTLAVMPAIITANARIQQAHEEGHYYFFAADEITQVLNEMGFHVGSVQTVYADQCWLMVATKTIAGDA